MTRQRRTGISILSILLAAAMLVCILPAAAPRADAVALSVNPLTKVDDTTWEFNDYSVFEDPDNYAVGLVYSDEHDGWYDIGFGFNADGDWKSCMFTTSAGDDQSMTMLLSAILTKCNIEDPSTITYGKVEGYSGCTISEAVVLQKPGPIGPEAEGTVPEVGQVFNIGDPINISGLWVYDLVDENGDGGFLVGGPWQIAESGTVAFDEYTLGVDPSGIPGWYGPENTDGEPYNVWGILVGGDEEDDYACFRPYDYDQDTQEVPTGIIFMGGTGTEEDPLLFNLVYAAKEDPEPDPVTPDVPEESAPVVAASSAKAASGGAPSLNAAIKEAEKAYTWGAKVEDNILTWEAAEGADSFVISARAYGEKTYKEIGTTKDKSFDLSSLKKGSYDIRVRYVKNNVRAKCRNSAYTIALIK